VRSCLRHLWPVVVLAVAIPSAAGAALAVRSPPRSAPTFVVATADGLRAFICFPAGRGATRAVKPSSPYVDHTWSPSGDRVAVVRNESVWTLDVMRPDGSRRRRVSAARLTRTVVPFGEPSWSPRGDWIAFIRDRSLFVVRADGRGLRRLLAPSPGQEWHTQPSWSPDGNRIFVLRVFVGPVLVRLLSVNRNGEALRSEPFHGQFSFGTYSPNRALVAWVTPEDRVEVVTATGESRQTVRATVPWPPSDLAWSPDGKELAYIRYGGGARTEVFVADVATGEEARVTHNRLVERDVAWKRGPSARYGRCGAR
jgi:Tol biopolymer transport system component